MVLAEAMDMFGLVVFVILLFAGMKVYKSKKESMKKCGFVIIIIAVLGLLVDSYIVIKTFVFGM